MDDSIPNGSNKRNQIKRKEKEDVEQQELNSPMLATRYAHKSSKLVYSIEKNFYLIIGIISLLFVLSLLDLLEVRGVFPFSMDTTITIASGVSIAFLGYTVRIILKSKRILESWADMFERNSIRAGMDISMVYKSKEEAVHAIAETVEEVGEPLRKYISSKDNFNEFLNVSVSNSSNYNDVNELIFDVLIDAEHVVKMDNKNNNEEISNNLVQALKEYGAIIIRVVDGTITKEMVASFSKQLHYYIESTKNDIRLAIIIGDDASEDSYKLAMKSERKRIGYFVLIEKPTSSLFVPH